MTTRKRLARELLRIEAFVFSPENPFTWASGIVAPMYCDNRLILGFPGARSLVIDAFAEAFDTLAEPRPDLIVGTATAGIPHAAWLSDRLDLPMAYVRSAAKKHGRGRQVEGVRPAGQRALLVEDLVSTGGSSITAVKALRSEGIDVNDVVAIFSYGLEASQTAFDAAGCRLRTLTNLESLLEVAVEDGRLELEQAHEIARWRAGLSAAPATSTD